MRQREHARRSGNSRAHCLPSSLVMHNRRPLCIGLLLALEAACLRRVLRHDRVATQPRAVDYLIDSCTSSLRM